MLPVVLFCFIKYVFIYLLHTSHAVSTVCRRLEIGSGRRVLPSWRGFRRRHFRARGSPEGIDPPRRRSRRGRSQRSAAEDLPCAMMSCIDAF